MRAEGARVPALPWLAAGFRPFYTLAVGYAVLLMGLIGIDFLLLAPPVFPRDWHGHEMIFGFALALIAGTVLTALPSWAGIPETQGGRLALLALCWLLGRVACFFAPQLPWPLVAACDLLLPLALVAHLAPRLLRLAQRRWCAPLAVFALLALANLAWHAASAAGDTQAAATALRAAVWAVLVMYTLAGGLVTPVFTANVLAARGRGAPRPSRQALEIAALLAIAAAAIADLGGVGGAGGYRPAAAALAWLAFALQLWRVLRWRGWRAADDLLVAAMHLGFVWLLLALALHALAQSGAAWAQGLWVHAFTVGALGSMLLTLMTRVALRHTGRPLAAPAALPGLLAAVHAAAVLRLAAPALDHWAWPAASLLWALAFAVWLAQHLAIMLRASLPRR